MSYVTDRVERITGYWEHSYKRRFRTTTTLTSINLRSTLSLSAASLAMLGGVSIYALKSTQLPLAFLILPFEEMEIIWRQLHYFLGELIPNSPGWIRYQLADLLWAFSIVVLLNHIWYGTTGTNRRAWCAFAISMLFIFEIAQYFYLNGTFDPLDMLAIFVGIFFALLFEYILSKEVDVVELHRRNP